MPVAIVPATRLFYDTEASKGISVDEARAHNNATYSLLLPGKILQLSITSESSGIVETNKEPRRHGKCLMKLVWGHLGNLKPVVELTR